MVENFGTTMKKLDKKWEKKTDTKKPKEWLKNVRCSNEGYIEIPKNEGCA